MLRSQRELSKYKASTRMDPFPRDRCLFTLRACPPLQVLDVADYTGGHVLGLEALRPEDLHWSEPMVIRCS
jgi:hypothetical protein